MEKEKVRIKDVLKKERFFTISNDDYVFIIDSHDQCFIDMSELGYTEDIDISDLFVKGWSDINNCNYKSEKAKNIRIIVDELNDKNFLEPVIEDVKNLNKDLSELKKGLGDYYGGENNTYEAIKVILAHDLGFCLGNVVKYVLRAGKKNKETEIEDLEKAKNYIDYRIKELKK